MVTSKERARRFRELRRAMGYADYSLLIFYGDKRWGKSGWVQYLFNYFLFNRQGYGIFPLEGEPSLIFPQRALLVDSQALGGRSVRAETGIDDEHVDMSSFKKTLIDFGIRKGSKIGLVNFIDMPAAEYLALVKECPDLRFEDAPSLFNSVRMVKSDEEVGYLRSSNLVAEHSFHRVLETMRIGADERDVMADAIHALHKMGARDFAWHILKGQNGDCSPVPGLPGDSYIFQKDDLAIPIIELVDSNQPIHLPI